MEENFFFQLEEELTFHVLEKWATSQKEWAKAVLSTRSFQQLLCHQISLETIFIRGIGGHTPGFHGSKSDWASQNAENLCSFALVERKPFFPSIHTLMLTDFVVQDCGHRASEKWLEFWTSMSESPSRAVSLVLKDSWPFMDLSSNHLSASFPRLSSLELSFVPCGNPSFVGNLPDDIGSLQELQVLKVELTRLNKLPASLANLVNLHHLEIKCLGSRNEWRLPANLENWKSLTHLSIQGAGFAYLPDSFLQLQSLETLHLRLCSSLILPDSVSNLRKLRDFCFNFPLQGFLMNSMRLLESMSFLEKLELNLSGTLVRESHFLNLSVLTCLKVEGVISAFPDVFQSLPLLVEISLSNLQNWSIPVSFTTLTKLTSLTFKELAIDSLPGEFENLVELLELHVIKCGLQVVPECIFRLTNLTSLSLRQNSISQLPEELADLSLLKCLDASSDASLSFPDNVTKLSQLTCFRSSGSGCPLGSCPFFVPSDFGGLASLKILELEYRNIQELPESLTQLSNLRELRLKKCLLSRMPDWFTKLSCLQQLDISGPTLKALPISFFQLECLTFLGCEKRLAEQYSDELMNMESLVQVEKTLWIF